MARLEVDMAAAISIEAPEHGVLVPPHPSGKFLVLRLRQLVLELVQGERFVPGKPCGGARDANAGGLGFGQCAAHWLPVWVSPALRMFLAMP